MLREQPAVIRLPTHGNMIKLALGCELCERDHLLCLLLVYQQFDKNACYWISVINYLIVCVVITQPLILAKSPTCDCDSLHEVLSLTRITDAFKT